jgi:excisionase family DNA binding protein
VDTAHVMIAAVPTLDQIAADPASAGNLPEGTLKALLVKCSVVQGVLITQLLDRKPVEADGSDAAPNRDPLVAAEEMARLLDVHPSWVRTEQRAGRIPFVKVVRYVRFRRSEVEHALVQRNSV